MKPYPAGMIPSQAGVISNSVSMKTTVGHSLSRLKLRYERIQEIQIIVHASMAEYFSVISNRITHVSASLGG